jgi:hypothetical protein
MENNKFSQKMKPKKSVFTPKSPKEDFSGISTIYVLANKCSDLSLAINIFTAAKSPKGRIAKICLCRQSGTKVGKKA